MVENHNPKLASFLSDNETRIDLLGNRPIAKTIIDVLLEQTDKPVTIGIHGDWGAGKSSILEMIEEELAGKDGVLCIKFNGWRFQGFEDAKIVLLEGIVTSLVEKRPLLTKAADKIKSIFKRIDWLKVAKNAGSLAITAFTGIPNFTQIQTLVSTIGTMFRDPSSPPTQEKISSLIDEAQSLLKTDSQSKNIPEEIEEFRKAFDILLEEAKIDRLIVLIDDLDRCLPDTAIETLEAIRLFVFTSRTAFVIASDEAMIEYAVRKHFPDQPETTVSQIYARNYLEKLIQIPFRIPPLGIAETRIYVTLLLVGMELGEDDPGFVNLITAARERFKRPWASEVIDISLIKSCLGDKAETLNDALFLSNQIGPILASGTNGNPRQIKRFLNTLLMRKRTADARGYGRDINIPVLAKLMLAERFIPKLFEQIAIKAISSNEGICEELNILETPEYQATEPSLIKEKPEFKQTQDKTKAETAQEKTEKETEGSTLEAWLKDHAIAEWAVIPPPLAGIDLRPYLFVTKDRKDYFGSTKIVGHLASIAETLFGPRIAVQAKEEDLQNLSLTEAIQIFDLVRDHIISRGIYDVEPPGIAGLSVLVKTQPKLQTNLLDFLESLPSDRLGIWAVRGWADVLVEDEATQRYGKLVNKWKNETSNPMLKATAEATFAILRTQKEG